MSELQLAFLALAILDRLIDTSITLARKDPDWKPKPLPVDFDGLVKGGLALKGRPVAPGK